MEQLVDDGMYIIDLGDVNSATDVIFQLSSILEKDEVRNKRICLKLGDVSLNQAQLLSIKSLISGIDSNLSSIATKSVDTEKVALSLGIIISNVISEKIIENAPAKPYKMAEELKEENEFEKNDNLSFVENKNIEINVNISTETQENVKEDTYSEDTALENNEISQPIVEESQVQIVSSEDELLESLMQIANEEEVEKVNNQENNIVQIECVSDIEQEEKIGIPVQENNTNSDVEVEDTTVNVISEDNTEINNKIEEQLVNQEQSCKEKQSELYTASVPPKEEIQDELDVIFGSNSIGNIFEVTQPTKQEYLDREELGELVIPEKEYTKEDMELEAYPTKYIKQTIRSGQVINYDGNIVIIGDCHPGCEVIAFGDITVWGVLGGIAHAGAGGNQKAKVRALKMNAIQLRIANCYSRRPDTLNTVYAEKTNSFTPEEARIVNGEIVVFKIND